MKDTHPSPIELARYASPQSPLSPQLHKEIEGHLRHCALCREEVATLRAFLADVEQRLSGEPQEIDHLVAQKLSGPVERKSLPAWEGHLLDADRSTLVRARTRVVRYVRENPFKTGAVASLAAALVIALATILKSPADTNPAKAAIRGSVLYVYNSAGQVLWTKDAPGLPDDSANVLYRARVEMRQHFLVIDIDGDLRNEVLLTNGLPKTEPGKLSCFEADGTLRWTYQPSGGLQWGKLDLSNQSYEIYVIVPVRDKQRGGFRLIVAVNALPHWPSKVVELSSRTGEELQSYWHAGHPSVGIVGDVNRDGKDEVILGGVNNTYWSAFVVVLDPDSFHGVGPTDAVFAPTGQEKGNEMYYILFPLTDLGKLLGAAGYNGTTDLEISPLGFLSARTNEVLEPPSREHVVYFFDNALAVTSALGDDFFMRAHEQAWREGKLKERATSEYFERLRKSVRYWDGEKFVSQPTMNKWYKHAPKLP